jgi:hypothetical protein
VRDAEVHREVDEKAAGEAEIRCSSGSSTRGGRARAQEAQAGPTKGLQHADGRRQEQIKEAMEYRLMGYTYRQIAERMEVAHLTAYKCVAEGLADITQETAEELRRVMMEQCHPTIQKLMSQMDETAPREVLDGIFKVQAQQMKRQRGGRHRPHQG